MALETESPPALDASGLPHVPEEYYEGARRIQVRYDEEKEKRLRPDGLDQYVEPAHVDTLRYLAADPWVDATRPVAPIDTVLPDSQCRALILGAGPSGLTTAAQLVLESHFRPEDVCVVDVAGGAGGAWYWNRYPGLMCDVESYVYLPMLEDTGYMPTHKYAYGGEIRRYCESLVQKYKFKTLYQAEVKTMTWDDAESCWVSKVQQTRTGEPARQVSIKSQFVSIVSGTLAHPKVPRWPGINDYQGQMFHTSRWHYSVTGGTADEPDMDNLKDKRVGFVGTGATAVQAVPALAKWAKELLVFQRTPSHVDVRGQRETTPDTWAKVSGKPGWAQDRHANLIANMTNAPAERPSEDMVSDGWSTNYAYAAMIGGQVKATDKNGDRYKERFHALDFPRSERIRARVDEIVHDKETAEKLKAYYAGFCKRPCFHDDYLPAFNQPNVKLIDTNGKGVDSLTKSGVVCNGIEYPVDVLILGTGFRTPGEQSHQRAGVIVTGRRGLTLHEKFGKKGMSTLHGILSRDFPNFLFNGPGQATASPSITFVFEQQSRHAAYIIREAEKRAGSPNFTIEPTRDAEEHYTKRCADGASQFGSGAGCLPSYMNKEGSMSNLTDEEIEALKRGAIWGLGCNDWVKMLKDWRDGDDLRGIEVVRVQDASIASQPVDHAPPTHDSRSDLVKKPNVHMEEVTNEKVQPRRRRIHSLLAWLRRVS